jgi:hypothetical protein
MFHADGMGRSASGCAAVSVLVAAIAGPARADAPYPAVLAGHAVLPAATFVSAPPDAPDSVKVSGKYTAPDGRRRDTPGSLPGASFLSDRAAPRPTGLGVPFAAGQPVQGFSGIAPAGEGLFWLLSDNGFGTKANSPDALLMVHRVRIDWARSVIDRRETLFLRDPDRVIPFHIVNEATPTRYLTGADLDPEAIQPVGDSLYIGDEFGPYLVRVDRSGKVTGFWETTLDGQTLRSPDHFTVTTPATPGPVTTAVRRSRGYEGMAAAPDGRTLYPLLEGPLWDEATRAWEQKDGREYLRILEFDAVHGHFTGRSWKYRLEANGHNIGDFSMIDASTGLIIERDNGEGDARLACAGAARVDCFNVPARFKRVYKIDLAQSDAEGFVKKIGYVDLLDIKDPAGRARSGTSDGVFTFPFVTIENVAVVDSEHIVVANDNNLPFSSGRTLGKNDDNEFILLRVPALLQAR